MAKAAEDAGFEALLRPIQDVLTKNWEVTLTKYLEEYLQHLRLMNDPNTNFSEAAMLLQNSAHFYCRRVDLVFDFMRKLIDDLTEKGTGEEGGATGTAPKRKKSAKTLHCEELEPLDSVYSEHNLDMRPEKKNKSERKQIVLNKTIKAQPKTNTSCTVYQAKGLELGFKEEFRLHWRISSDGTLHSDIINSEKGNLNLTEVSFHDDNFSDGGGSIGMCEDDMGGEDMMGRESEVDPVPGQEELLPQDRELSFLDQPLPSPRPPSQHFDNEEPAVSPPQKRQRETSKKVVDPWEPSKPAATLQLLKFKKKKIYKLPKNFIEPKKLRTKEEEERSRNGLKPSTFLCHNTIIWNKKDVHPFDFKMEEAAMAKNKILFKRRTSARLRNKLLAEHKEDIVPEPQLENDNGDFNDDDFHDDGFGGGLDISEDDEVGGLLEDDVGGLRPVDVELVNLNCGGSPHKDTSSYEMDAQIVMEKYQAQVKYNMNTDLEIARRVEKWHEKLEPVLRIAEARSEFDVQDYCSRILEVLPMEEERVSAKEREVTPFSRITRGQPKEEICRFFLSTLMLANMNNVEVVRTEEGELKMDCLGVRLLSRVRHHEEMDDNLRATSTRKH